MRIYLLIAGLLLSFLNSKAETESIDLGGMIEGMVSDSAGNPVKGLDVHITGTLFHSVTDANGKYKFKNLSPGSYIIESESSFSLIVPQSVEVKDKEKVVVNLTVRAVSQSLAEITISSGKGLTKRERLPDVEGTTIYAGKKTEVIRPDDLNANLITNTSRQIFAKSAGVMIWENDGSGAQVGVSVRGLSPNRSWEFNVRQNGIDISSDPFGYPEAYYQPPMEAVSQIQIVRGSAALQYGPQFGGLLNYIVHQNIDSSAFYLRTQQSVGSYGLFSSYNTIGGHKGRFNYNLTGYYRRADGWRPNSDYSLFNGIASVGFIVSNKLKLGFELSHFSNRFHQAGGLTEEQFKSDPSQSTRARNWFSTPWTVPVLTADYIVSNKTKLSLKIHGLIGERNSIGYVRSINLADTIDASGNFTNRQLDRDFYKNYGAELRILSNYSIGRMKNTLATGVKYFSGNTHRLQLGKGDQGSEYNTSLAGLTYTRDLDLSTSNIAVFAENIFRISQRLTIAPGIRMEMLDNSVNGRIGYTSSGSSVETNQTNERRFLLFGASSEYKLKSNFSVYGNFSQAYRPVLFSDLTPGALADFVIDPDLKDASGYNADLGIRGSFGNFFNFDVSGFYLAYNDRIGTMTLLNSNQTTYQYRTNIGNSYSRGVEAFAEFDPTALMSNNRFGNISFFGSVCFMEAHYDDFVIKSVTNGQPSETSLKNKKVEYAPEFIGRFGLNYLYRTFGLTASFSKVSQVYSDANNTEIAPANAQSGLVPAYTVIDLSASIIIAEHFNVKSGINNLMNESYFTRRSGGYPGPGILPGEARTFYLSVGYRF